MNSTEGLSPAVAEAAQGLSREKFRAPARQEFGSRPAWAALRALGTELWLDTGDLDAARELWTDDFSNLTTNNTLINKEVQKGLFDEAIPLIGRVLRDAAPSLSLDALVTEVGFVLNCRTALRLVSAFDARVSVELHPAMAHDAALSTEYGRRYYAVCPERFIVKVPLTPAGFLAARALSQDGIPVNYTLGFSARQNVLAAAFSRPTYVNIFMGRLNSFVADHGLGSGENVGERATMASQRALREGRERRGWQTSQIGASMRSGAQVRSLAGLDVYTMPVAAAQEYLRAYEADPRPVESQLDADFPVEAGSMPVLDVLWREDAGVYAAAEALAGADTDGWTGADLAGFVRDHGAPDLFRAWTGDESAQIRADGKVPSWNRWKQALTAGEVALDDLMTQSALQAFVVDQEQLDGRIRRLLTEAGLS